MTRKTELITVTAAIIESDGRYLAARKRSGLDLAGYWEFPGGKLEAGESPEQCLRRELAEEFGISCEIGQFLAESVHDYGNRSIRLLGYRARHTDGKLQLSDHDAILWLQPGELGTLNWAPADIPLVEALMATTIHQQTISFYTANAEKYARETIGQDMTAVHNQFLGLLPEHGHILDLGCGSGRDSKRFLEQGYRVTAMDGCPAMAEQAAAYIGQQVLILQAQDLSAKCEYDGIWACASLVHLAPCELPGTLRRLAGALKPDGILYLSFRNGIKEGYDDLGRYFNGCTGSQLREMLEASTGIEIIRITETLDMKKRPLHHWLNVFAGKRALP